MYIFLHGGASSECRFDFSLVKSSLHDAGVKKLLFVVLAIKELEIQKMWTEQKWLKSWGDVEVRILSIQTIEDALSDIEWANGLFFNGGSQEKLMISLNKAGLIPKIKAKIRCQK